MATYRSGREFDLVVFGASGFTGKYVVEYLTKINGEGHKWAIAGRSQAKLKKVLQEITTVTGTDVKNIPIIEADVDNEKSLADMCKRAKLILNCVGPYRFYGEAVVKACIQNGSHHLDISGETAFLESMQIKYHDEAKKANVYIVGSAGLDSIPAETGIQFLQQKFEGDVEYVETFMHMKAPKLYKINIGTLKSAIHHLVNEHELQSLHDQIFTKPIPKSDYPLKSRGILFYNKEINKWCVPFPNTDADVVNRTQYYNYQERKMRPVHMKAYLVVPNCILGLLLLIFWGIYTKIAHFKFVMYLEENYPWLALGLFSKYGASRTQIENASLIFYLIGHGHDTKLNEPEEQHSTSPNKTMIVKLNGPDPGYVSTSIFMVQAALTVLHETDKLPDKGGVFPPGAAFLNTSLISRISREGINYSVIR